MERVASELIRENTIAYAKQILSNIFPNAIDGFKKVRRRIIVTQPPDRLFGGQELISNTIRIHPYGDGSIYETGCRMAESFRYAFPLLYLKGNTGSYNGSRAASARYTKFKLTDFCKDVFLNGINFKTIPTELTEDLSDYEIKYFIPKIPTALLYNNDSIGFGYSSSTMPLKFENVCDLAIDFVSCSDKRNWDYSKLIKKFVPSFSIRVYIKNKEELLKSYRNGDFECPIETEGHYQIVSPNTVLIRTVSYGASPKMIYEKLTQQLKDKSSWLAKNDINVNVFSDDRNYFDLQLASKKGLSVFSLIEKMKKLTFLRTKIHPINNYVFDDKMYNLSPIDVINMWYRERYRSIFSSKKHRQQELQSAKLRVSAYLVVCEHVDEVISIIRQNKPNEEIFEDLRKRFELSVQQCKVLMASNLEILTRSRKKELEERMNKINTDLDNLNESFKSIDEEIVKDIEYLKKKYRTDTTFSSKESNYIGCLLISNNGMIQIQNEDEISDMMTMFSNCTFRYIQYKGCSNVQLGTNTYSIDALPYTSDQKNVILSTKGKSFVFTRENKRSHINSTLDMSIDSKGIFNFISDNPLGIMSDGSIATIGDKKYLSNVLYAFDSNEEEFVVISFNDAHPNIIRFQKATTNDKVMFSNAGDTSILAVVPVNSDDFIINMPGDSKISLIKITDIEKNASKNKVNDINIRGFRL